MLRDIDGTRTKARYHFFQEIDRNQWTPAEAIYAPPYQPYTEALLTADLIPDPNKQQKHNQQILDIREMQPG